MVGGRVFCTKNAMATPNDYPRDLAGYGRNAPDPRWPGGARVALQFVVNFEEGGENSILHGDQASRLSFRTCWVHSLGADSAT